MLVVNIAMAMVVGGGTHLYTKYHGRTQHYLLANKLIRCLRLFVLPWQHVTWLVKCC